MAMLMCEVLQICGCQGEVLLRISSSKGEVFVIVWRTPLPRVVISAVDLLCLRAAEYDAIADMSASINSGVGV